MASTILTMSTNWIKFQEAVVHLDEGRAFVIHLNETPPGFEAELFLPLDPGATHKTMLREVHDGAAEAFGWAIRQILAYCEARALAADAEVDNPCNTEFLPGEEQAALLAQMGLGWKVKVNGR